MAHAAPSGGEIVTGTVTIVQEDTLTEITASDGAIIKWTETFDIHRDETVRFIQPTDTARVLNRVFGPQTRIDGSLLANGQVYIVNPSGIFFGGNAFVDVGRLVAAAGTLNDSDFAATIDAFTNLTGAVENHGTIQAGGVNLLGRTVANRGAVITPDGMNAMIAMVAGRHVMLTSMDGHIRVMISGSIDDPGTWGVENTGLLDAGQGEIVLMAGDVYSLAANHTGISRGSLVQIAGGAEGRVAVAGTVDLSSPDAIPATLEVSGGSVTIGDLSIEVSGAMATGQIEFRADDNFSMDESGTFATNGADLAISAGSGIVVGSIDTSGGEGSDAGDIALSILETGDIDVKGNLEAIGGSIDDGTNGGDGGNITITTIPDIETTSSGSIAVAGRIDSSGGAGATGGDGGSILLSAAGQPAIPPKIDSDDPSNLLAEGIPAVPVSVEVEGELLAAGGDSLESELGGHGGAIEITALVGSIAVAGRIDSSGGAGATGGDGGSIRLSAEGQAAVPLEIDPSDPESVLAEGIPAIPASVELEGALLATGGESREADLGGNGGDIEIVADIGSLRVGSAAAPSKLDAAGGLGTLGTGTAGLIGLIASGRAGAPDADPDDGIDTAIPAVSGNVTLFIADTSSRLDVTGDGRENSTLAVTTDGDAFIDVTTSTGEIAFEQIEVTQTRAAADIKVTLAEAEFLTATGTPGDENEPATSTVTVAAGGGIAVAYHLSDSSGDRPALLEIGDATPDGDTEFSNRDDIRIPAGSIHVTSENAVLTLRADSDADGVGAILSPELGTHITTPGDLVLESTTLGPLRIDGGGPVDSSLKVVVAGSVDIDLVNPVFSTIAVTQGDASADVAITQAGDPVITITGGNATSTLTRVNTTGNGIDFVYLLRDPSDPDLVIPTGSVSLGGNAILASSGDVILGSGDSANASIQTASIETFGGKLTLIADFDVDGFGSIRDEGQGVAAIQNNGLESMALALGAGGDVGAADKPIRLLDIGEMASVTVAGVSSGDFFIEATSAELRIGAVDNPDATESFPNEVVAGILAGGEVRLTNTGSIVFAVPADQAPPGNVTVESFGDQTYRASKILVREDALLDSRGSVSFTSGIEGDASLTVVSVGDQSYAGPIDLTGTVADVTDLADLTLQSTEGELQFNFEVEGTPHLAASGDVTLQSTTLGTSTALRIDGGADSALTVVAAGPVDLDLDGFSSISLTQRDASGNISIFRESDTSIVEIIGLPGQVSEEPDADGNLVTTTLPATSTVTDATNLGVDFSYRLEDAEDESGSPPDLVIDNATLGGDSLFSSVGDIRSGVDKTLALAGGALVLLAGGGVDVQTEGVGDLAGSSAAGGFSLTNNGSGEIRVAEPSSPDDPDAITRGISAGSNVSLTNLEGSIVFAKGFESAHVSSGGDQTYVANGAVLEGNTTLDSGGSVSFTSGITGDASLTVTSVGDQTYAGPIDLTGTVADVTDLANLTLQSTEGELRFNFAVDPLANEFHLAASGDVTLQSTTLGTTGTPLRIDAGVESALTVVAAGSVYIDLDPDNIDLNPDGFSSIFLTQRDATGDVSISQGTDISVVQVTGRASEVGEETDADGNPVTVPATSTITVDTTAQPSSFVYRLEDIGDESVPPADLVIASATLGGDSLFSSAGDILSRDAESRVLGSGGSLVLLAGGSVGAADAPIATQNIADLAGRADNGGFSLTNRGSGDIRVTALTSPDDPDAITRGISAGSDVSLAQTLNLDLANFVGSIVFADGFESAHVSSGGDQTYGADILLQGDTLLVSGGSVAFESGVDAADGNDASFGVVADGAIDFQSIGTRNSLDNLIAESGGDQTYAAAVVLNQDALLTSTGGDISFVSTIDGGAYDLAALGDIRFGGAIGPRGPLESLATNGLGATVFEVEVEDGTVETEGRTVVTEGLQSYGNRVELAGATTFTSLSDEVIFAGALDGPGGATINSNGAAIFRGDIGTSTELDHLRVHLVHPDQPDPADVIFEGAAQRVVVGTGGISLNPTGHASVPVDPETSEEVATIYNADGSVAFITTGDFAVGEGEVISVAGRLSIEADGAVTVGDVVAFDLVIDTPELTVHVRDENDDAHLIANRMVLSSVPNFDGAVLTLATQDGEVRVPGPIPAEFSVRLINDRGRAIGRSDLANPTGGAPLDLTATGPPAVGTPVSAIPRSQAAVQEPVEPRFDEEPSVPTTSRPEGDEVLAFLRCADLGGGVSPGCRGPVAAGDASPHPALATPRAEGATRLYRQLIGPGDESQRGRRAYRSALDAYAKRAGSGFDGAGFYRYLEGSPAHASALRTVDQLATLFVELELLDLETDALHRLRRQIAQQFLDSMSSTEDEPGVDTLLDTVDSGRIGLPR